MNEFMKSEIYGPLFRVVAKTMIESLVKYITELGKPPSVPVEIEVRGIEELEKELQESKERLRMIEEELRKIQGGSQCGKKGLEARSKQQEMRSWVEEKETIIKNAKKEAREEAMKEIGIDCIDHYNIAVCGQAGVGKSSFVNAIRFIKDFDDGAAKVGTIESEGEIRPYPHPLLDNVVVWDMPGAGSLTHPISTYFYDKKLYAFDCILIVTSNRFLDVDMRIAKSALENKKHVAFLRTKADEIIPNMANSKEITAQEACQKCRFTIQSSFNQNLKKANLYDPENANIPLFIISSKAFTNSNTYHIKNYVDPTILDTSLDMMDEDKLCSFISQSVTSRFVES